jgi:prepilin-type N-terminal cleavage/methylation domain-containing protein
MDMKKADQLQSGFSLAELMVSVGIMGIVTMGVVSMSGENQKVLSFLTGEGLAIVDIADHFEDMLSSPIACNHQFSGRVFEKSEEGFSFKDGGNIVLYRSVKIVPGELNASEDGGLDDSDAFDTGEGSDDAEGESDGDPADSDGGDAGDIDDSDDAAAIVVEDLPPEYELGEIIAAANKPLKRNGMKISAFRAKSLREITPTLFEASIELEVREKETTAPYSTYFRTLLSAEKKAGASYEVTGCYLGTKAPVIPLPEPILKIPPIKEEIFYKDQVRWRCQKIDIEKHCADDDGCKVIAYMQHETQGSDQVRTYKSMIYLEQADMSLNRGVGKYGWRTSESGGTVGFVLGNGTRYNFFAPWEWFYLLNYDHKNCWVPNAGVLPEPYIPGTGAPRGSHSGGYIGSDLYKINVLVHPKVKLRLEIYD